MGLLNGTTSSEDLHEMDRLLGSSKDRTTRERIAQALAAARPASPVAAKQVVDPAESALDEPSLARRNFRARRRASY